MVGVHQPRRKAYKGQCEWRVVWSARQPFVWKKPNRLPKLYLGDTAKEQVVCLAFGAPEGECDNTISALKLVRNMIKGKKLGVELKKAVRKDLRKPWRPSSLWKSARVLVAVGELAQSKEVHQIVLPNFNKSAHKHAEVIEREEVITFRSEKQGTQNTS